MSRKTLAVAAVSLAAVAVSGVGLAVVSRAEPTPKPQDAPVNTAAVERGDLSAMVSQGGTLTYRARPDGSPYVVVNQARGLYTELPENGDRVDCGDVLYRVDAKPVLLLCGSVPLYRDLFIGRKGKDVVQLNHNLHRLGDRFTATTRKALKKLQRGTGGRATGRLALGDAVFLPEAVRIAKVTGVPGASARPGAPVLEATSDKLRVQVALDPSEQGAVHKGDHAQVTLPGSVPVTGRVEAFGRVAQSAGKDGKPADATIPTYIRLDDPRRARGLDQAPVQVDITTEGVRNALSVPVTALVGRAGGAFAVEVVRARGRRQLVDVKLGLFDTGGGRVQVEGALRAGDHVVVPSP